MADMIDAAKAKEMLGCDDATLNGYINNGSIRAQRVGGKLMVMQEDVEKFAQDDGTIVITGDSQDLQIDLGKVAETAAKKDGTQSITFGDDLEVVSFDDTGTKDLKYGSGGKPAAPARPARGQSSFTDANTEVMSAVEEPAAQEQTEVTRSAAQSDRSMANASARRSVRSSRSYVEAPKIQPIWAVVMLATFVVAAAFVIPYHIMTVMPRGEGAKDIAGNVQRGVDDNFMTNLAAVPAGFSAEPDRAWYKKTHGSEEGFVDIFTIDNQATWRIKKYLDRYEKHSEPGARLKSFTITKVEVDESQTPTQATNALGEVFKVVSEKKTTAAGDVTVYRVDMATVTGGAAPAPAVDPAEGAPAPATTN